MDRAGELDLALDALDLAAAEGDPGTDARWLPEGIVAEAQQAMPLIWPTRLPVVSTSIVPSVSIS